MCWTSLVLSERLTLPYFAHFTPSHTHSLHDWRRLCRQLCCPASPVRLTRFTTSFVSVVSHLIDFRCEYQHHRCDQRRGLHRPQHGPKSSTFTLSTQYNTVLYLFSFRLAILDERLALFDKQSLVLLISSYPRTAL